MNLPVSYRPWRESDDVEALTSMLHRAYAPLAEEGLRFTATHQTPEITQRRLARGFPLMAVVAERIVGTLTVYPPSAEYLAREGKDPETYDFGQFGIEPGFKGQGIGRTLHGLVLIYAAARGGRFMELDTAAPAGELIATYERWGYRVTGRLQGKTTNYESVIMTRPVQPLPPPGDPCWQWSANFPQPGGIAGGEALA